MIILGTRYHTKSIKVTVSIDNVTMNLISSGQIILLASLNQTI